MGKGSLISKKRRQDELMGLLRSQEFWQSVDLCQRLQVSYRTLMRDLNELKEIGVPIETDRGPGGGISLKGRWGLSRLELNHQEVISLLLSLAITESMQSPILIKNMKSIRMRIHQSFAPEQRSMIESLKKRIFVGSIASQHVMQSYHPPQGSFMDELIDCFFQYKKIKRI